jgi:hypothetical protein
MYWLLVPVVLYFGISKIAPRLLPFLPSLPPQKIVFYGHFSALAASLIYILPVELFGLGALKRVAYLASLWFNVLTSLWTIKSNYGAPPIPQIGGLSLTTIKQSATAALQTMAPWLQKAMMGVDFNFLFLALIFLTAYPSVWVLVILGRRSLWSVCKYAESNMQESRLWLLFKTTWDKLKAKEAEVLHYSTMAEILLGFWLVVNIFLPSRQILTCILYWNFLKTRYQVPRSHPLHAKAWLQIRQQVDPVLKKVPLLERPIDIAKGWFQPQMA